MTQCNTDFRKNLRAAATVYTDATLGIVEGSVVNDLPGQARQGLQAKNTVSIDKIIRKLQQVYQIWLDVTDVQNAGNVTDPQFDLASPGWKAIMRKLNFETHHISGMLLCFAANTAHDTALQFITAVFHGDFLKNDIAGPKQYDKLAKGAMAKPPSFLVMRPMFKLFKGRIFAFIGDPASAKLSPDPVHVKLFTKNLIPDGIETNDHHDLYKSVASSIPEQSRLFYKRHGEKHALRSSLKSGVLDLHSRWKI